MRIVLVYIFCGIGLLSTCFGMEGALTIQNNTAFTLVFPSGIKVYADQARSSALCRIRSVPANPVEPYSSSIIEYTKKGWWAGYCDYTRQKEVNYSFYVQFQGSGAPDDKFWVEVNYPQGESNQWVDLFEDEDEDKNYKETLRIVWEDAIIAGKPGVAFYQTPRMIRGGNDLNPQIEGLREAGDLEWDY